MQDCWHFFMILTNQKFTPKTDAGASDLVIIRNYERTAKIRAAADSRNENVITEHRQKIYRLQDKSAKILDSIFHEKNGVKKQTHRVVFCSRHRIDAEKNILIYVNKDTKRAQYSNVLICGSVWTCPKCANRITTTRSIEVLTAIKKAPAFAFMTLTTPHHRNMRLSQLLDLQAHAKIEFFRSHRVRNLFKLIRAHGRITATECSWGEINGWHPHYHALIFLDDVMTNPIRYATPYRMHKIWTPAPRVNRFGNITYRDEFAHQIFYFDFQNFFQKTLAHEWVNACHSAGMTKLPSLAHGLDFQAITDKQAMKKLAGYMTKYGCMPAGNRINNELTKWHTKTKKHPQGEPLVSVTPFELLDMADPSNPDCVFSALWREFANALKGTKQLAWSNGLKERYAVTEKSDDEISQETEENAEKVFEITYTIWRLITERNERTVPLELAEEDYLDGGSRVHDYCIGVLIEHIEKHKTSGTALNHYILHEAKRILEALNSNYHLVA